MNKPVHLPKQARFRWRALDSDGHSQSGQIQAKNADLARVMLRRQGLQHVHLQRLWWSRTESIKAKELSIMTRQWAAMQRAGVPVVQALGMLCRSMQTKALVQVMQSVRSDVESGMSLHTALDKHPRHFSSLFVHMVQAGESAGILDAMMERLSITLEKNEALRSKIWSALMYPITVLIVALGILVLVLVLVVPVFQDVFQSFGAELPWSTQLVVNLSDALVNGWPVVLVLLLTIYWVSQQNNPTIDRFKDQLAHWLLTWPLLGRLLITAVAARWAQTLSALLAVGVPLAEALGPTAQACDHPVFERTTLQLQRRVIQGSSLSEAMSQVGLFPVMIVQLCATGEETGTLDSLLHRAGDLLETELNDQVNGLTSLLEPLIIVVLGGFIGAILVAMYLPIFSLGQVF